MTTKLIPIFMLAAAGLLLMAGSVRAEQNSPRYLAANSALEENTGRNVRDKDNTTLTPEDQQESEGDIKITANVRKAIVERKSLSVNARNIKVITRNGVVTLRGPVDSQAESTELQQIVKQTAGVTQVDNQLEIKAP